MLKVAILDDYQNVSQQFVDLEKLSGKYEFKIFSQPFVDETDAPDVINSAVEKGMLCDPEEVVDQIEKDILTDKIICYPTKEAVYATRIRRFFPNYWWKLVAKNS